MVILSVDNIHERKPIDTILYNSFAEGEIDMKICPQCKNENPDFANYCRFCRNDLRYIQPDLGVDEEMKTVGLWDNDHDSSKWDTDYNATSYMGEDPEEKTQLLYGDDRDDYSAGNEALIRQRRAEEQRRAREKRRRQGREFETNSDRPVMDGEYHSFDGSGADANSSGGDWNSEWIKQTTPEQTPPDKKSSPIIMIILALAALAILILGILLLMKLREKPDKTSQDAGTSTHVASQVEVSDPSEAGEDPGDIDDEDLDQVQFSQEDFDEGSYNTVVTLKSLQLDGVALYSEPDGISFDSIPEAVPCALVSRKSVGGVTWDYIAFCGKTGWVKDQYVRNVSGGIEYFYVGNNYGDTVFVTKKRIKVHSKPESTAKTVTAENIPYGSEFRIDELKDGWGHSYYNGKECWIDMNVTGFYSSLIWQIERGDGKNEGINLREKPSEDSRKLTKIPVRTMIYEIEHWNGWAKVNYGGKTGWVKLHYATPCGDNGLDFSEG